MSGTTYRKLKSSNKLLIPAILMMGFVPLIVQIYNYQTGLSQYDWFPDSQEMQVDFFFAWKMIAIILLGVVMAGVLLYRRFQKKEAFKFENAFYLLAFYALFVAMSALFSKYRHWVSAGTYELFEPVWVVFAYMILCYYVYQYVQEEKQVSVLLGWSGIGMLIVSVIGAFQTFGMDFFKTVFGKMLILGPANQDMLDRLNFTMAENTAYTTLYNPNFLSFYFGMIIPLVACLFIATKKIWCRILLVIAEILAFICLKGSGSDSGWLALVIGIGIVVVVLCSRTKKSMIAVAAAAVAGIVAVIVVCATTSFGQKLVSTVAGTYRLEEAYALRDIQTGTEGAFLDINGNQLHAYSVLDEEGNSQVACTDADGNILPMTCIDEENKIFQIDDSRYNGNLVGYTDELGNYYTELSDYGSGAACTVRPCEYGDGVCVNLDGVDWNFIRLDDEMYYYVNPAGKLVTYEAVKTSRLFRDDAMSFRGRIWNNTIPVLGKHVFIGSGANTYVLETPQNDYIYKACINAQGSFDVKAHNWYLQQWVENGMLGMLLVLAFCLWYVVKSVKIYRRASLSDALTWVGIGLFTAVVVYLAAAIANDSNVCTAPLFWGLLGLGMAVNRILVEKEEEQKQPKNQKK